MSVLLNDAATEYLGGSSSPISGTVFPITMAIHYNTNDVALVNPYMMCLTDVSLNTEYIGLVRTGPELGGPTQGKIQALRSTGGVTRITFSNVSDGNNPNEWHHAAFVASSSTSMFAYLDGVPGAEEANANDPTGIDTAIIGAWKIASTTLYYWSGLLAEAAIWDVALTTVEIALLSAGYSPLFVRPGNLVKYWPLKAASATPDSGDYMDLMTGNMFDVNTDGLDAEHPRIIYPSGGIQIYEGSIDTGTAAHRRAINRGVGFGVFR